jgi:dolichyl-phosphate beta-glucosyltransferase
MTEVRPVGIVVPCYNEADRLDHSALVTLAEHHDEVRWILVDDGSTDETPSALEAIRQRLPERARVVTLSQNRGKGEAVRRGLLTALELGYREVGYLDADLSTPPDEFWRLLRVMRAGEWEIVMGARVGLLGRAIERRAVRHYLGRLFATAASAVLALPVYDTQCGAKLFACPEALQTALREPFTSRWSFDVELLARLTRGPRGAAPARIREEPLEVWRDVPGSKVSALGAVRMGVDLARIAWRYRGQ